MANPNFNYGARYGIYGMSPYGKNAIDRAMQTYGSLQKMKQEQGILEAQRLKNQAEELALSQTMQTQPGLIDYLNAKTAADTKYYGQQEAAKLGLTNAQIKELEAKAARERQLAGLSNTMIGAGFLPDGQGGWIKDPRMGSYRSGMGGTYINPETGEIVSTDTSTQASRDQRAITAEKNLDAYINKISEIPTFATLADQAKLNAARLGNWVLGQDNPEPTQRALYDANVLSAAEGFINAFGLNATNENVSKAAQIMRRQSGESDKNYKDRLRIQLGDFAGVRQRAEERLAGGTQVKAPASPAFDFSQMTTDQIKTRIAELQKASKK